MNFAAGCVPASELPLAVPPPGRPSRERAMTRLMLKQILGVALLALAWFSLNSLDRSNRPERVPGYQVLVLKALAASHP